MNAKPIDASSTLAVAVEALARIQVLETLLIDHAKVIEVSKPD